MALREWLTESGMQWSRKRRSDLFFSQTDSWRTGSCPQRGSIGKINRGSFPGNPKSATCDVCRFEPDEVMVLPDPQLRLDRDRSSLGWAEVSSVHGSSRPRPQRHWKHRE